jgi:hypothetical protein
LWRQPSSGKGVQSHLSHHHLRQRAAGRRGGGGGHPRHLGPHPLVPGLAIAGRTLAAAAAGCLPADRSSRGRAGVLAWIHRGRRGRRRRSAERRRATGRRGGGGRVRGEGQPCGDDGVEVPGVAAACGVSAARIEGEQAPGVAAALSRAWV